MRELATAIAERSQRLAWQLYSRMSLRFSKGARDSHRELTDDEWEYVQALHRSNARSIGETWLQELREYPELIKLLRDRGKHQQRGKPPGRHRGSRNYTEEYRKRAAEDYGRRRARGQPREAAAGLVGHHPDTLEKWAQELGIDCI